MSQFKTNSIFTYKRKCAKVFRKKGDNMGKIKEYTKLIFKSLINPKNKLSLIPNWLSFTRAIGGVAMPIMAYSGASPAALVTLLSTLAISDFLDGKAARYIAKEETKEGAVLDAISDKIFSLSLIVGIIAISPIFIINGLLEGTIALINAKSFEEGDNPKSNQIGKIKIWPLSAALILGYLGYSMGNTNFLGISPELITTTSLGLSLATIPLEIINIKQYHDETKTKSNRKKEKIELNKHENKNEQKYEKTNTKENKIAKNKIKPKYKLEKNKNNQILIIKKEEIQEEKQLEKGKQKKKGTIYD